MSQLQKKSFFASVAGHFLLLALLFVLPAFFVAKYEPSGASKSEPSEATITLLPNQQVEKKLIYPSRRNPATASSPQSSSQTGRMQISQPINKLPHVDVSDLVIRNRPDELKPIQKRDASKRPGDLEKHVNDALESIRKQISSGNKYEPILPESRTEDDYRNFVQAAYDNAWLVPEGLVDDGATVKVSVTVLRNGVVFSSQILKRSDSPTLDASIEAVLDRVKAIGRPFPNHDRDAQRTFVINFNLRAKQNL